MKNGISKRYTKNVFVFFLVFAGISSCALVQADGLFDGVKNALSTVVREFSSGIVSGTMQVINNLSGKQPSLANDPEALRKEFNTQAHAHFQHITASQYLLQKLDIMSPEGTTTNVAQKLKNRTQTAQSTTSAINEKTLNYADELVDKLIATIPNAEKLATMDLVKQLKMAVINALNQDIQNFTTTNDMVEKYIQTQGFITYQFVKNTLFTLVVSGLLLALINAGLWYVLPETVYYYVASWWSVQSLLQTPAALYSKFSHMLRLLSFVIRLGVRLSSLSMDFLFKLATFGATSFGFYKFYNFIYTGKKFTDVTTTNAI